jgi:hypothetical protein
MPQLVAEPVPSAPRRLCDTPDGSALLLLRLEPRADLPALKSPPVPDDVLLLLKECVAVMDDDPAAVIVELISHLQIQRTRFTAYMSRLEDHPHDSGNALQRGHIDHGIWDAAEVYARASSLFPFARGEMTSSFALRAWPEMN